MRKILCIFALAASAMLVHAGAASAQNAVILRATLNGGEETPAAVLSGAVATAEVTVDSLRPAFHARPEIGINTFADIHTTAFPGDEIRRQLCVADPKTPQYPTQ